ncbi:MAG TPA: hypothetical protein VMH77_06690 [Steroidobacteraceae bacterium]|nr:hypothetical protein [Steroidobacteraceae bacterium]
MNTRLKLLGAVLLKDLRLFWLFAALTAVLNVVANFKAIVQLNQWTTGLVPIAVFLATNLFILLVFHEDSAVSGKRDWLTRPVPGMTMLAAKCIFVVVATVLPGVLGLILNEFHVGRPPVVALISGAAKGLTGAALLGPLGVMALAALTSNIRQAIVAVVAGMVVLFAGYGVWMESNAAFESGFPDNIDAASGSAWILMVPLELLGTLAALAVLWILYRRHHGRRAALVLVGVVTLAGGTFLATMNWSRMFGLQKWLSPDPAAGSSVAVSLLPGCFAVRTVAALGETGASAAGKIPARIFSDEQRGRAGDDAVAIAVRLVVDHIPEDGQLVVGRAQLTYRTADGAAVLLGTGRTNQRSDQQWVKTDTGHRAMDQYWLLSKKDYQRLAADPGTTTHIDYSLSLLGPRATAVFKADGRGAFRAGVGHCGAIASRADKGAGVYCYRIGSQPALLAARLDGRSNIEDRASGYPDFTPAILDFWGGRLHYMYVADAAASQVRVTAYEARAHFTRQFDVPGVLGGPVSSCPLP